MDIKKIWESLVPFVLLGVIVALCIGLLLLLFSLAVWGVIIGAILWVVANLKEYFFPSRPITYKEGKIIEHDDS